MSAEIDVYRRSCDDLITRLCAPGDRATWRVYASERLAAVLHERRRLEQILIEFEAFLKDLYDR